jgi:autotransporter-associated beta strand protein
MGADLSWQGLVATNNTGNWTISGANTLTLGTGGIKSVGSGAGYLQIDAGVNQSSAATYDAGKIIWINGALSGSGKITKTGGSVLILNANNSGFSGGITHSAGVISVGNANALGTGVLTLNGGKLNAYSTDQTIANDIVVTASSTLEAVNTTRDLTLTGAISGSGAITKVNAGTVTLSFDNAYSGGTTVSAGTMVGSVDGAFGVGDVTVANGATLVLGVGTSSQDYIDNLADLVLGNTSVLTLNFTGTDTVGSLSLDGGLTFLSPGTYNAADLDAAGLGTYTGVGSLTVIPEPATLGMLGLGALITILVRRMRI